MKKNRTAFLKIKILIIVILSNFLAFSLTVEDIIAKSKVDPEFAWDMYLLYISNQQTSDTETIDKLGKFLHAKRKLKDYEFAVKEDIEGLVNFLKSASLTKVMRYYLIDIFNKDTLLDYAINNVQNNPDVLYLFDVIIDVINEYDYEKISEELINVLLKDGGKKGYVQILSKVQSKDKLLRSIVKVLFEKLSKEKTEEKKQRYLEIYNSIVEYYPEYKEPNLKSSYKSSTPALKNLQENIQKLLEIISKKMFSSLKYLLLLVVAVCILLFSILLSFPIVRYYVWLTFGIWRKAALNYRKVVEKDPLNENKRLKLAQLYEKAGMYDEALNEYNFLKRIKLE
ncbi:MAG: hypothetical protein N2Z58_08375 [Fervidobacterium sp.]|nr:hypothetical protein [Fervidobacterium sp.]